MTRETAQKHREAYNAFCEGKPIQILSCLNGEWVECNTPNWSHDREYRIKPREPREFYIIAWQNGAYSSPYTEMPRTDSPVMRVREILDERGEVGA